VDGKSSKLTVRCGRSMNRQVRDRQTGNEVDREN